MHLDHLQGDISENDTDASKHVGILAIYKILYICCAFVGLDNKLYKMHGTLKLKKNYPWFCTAGYASRVTTCICTTSSHTSSSTLLSGKRITITAMTYFRYETLRLPLSHPYPEQNFLFL